MHCVLSDHQHRPQKIKQKSQSCKSMKKQNTMRSFLLPDDLWGHIKAFTCDPRRFPHPIARLYASYCDGRSNFWRLEAKTLYDPRIGSLFRSHVRKEFMDIWYAYDECGDYDDDDNDMRIWHRSTGFR